MSSWLYVAQVKAIVFDVRRIAGLIIKFQFCMSESFQGSDDIFSL